MRHDELRRRGGGGGLRRLRRFGGRIDGWRRRDAVGELPDNCDGDFGWSIEDCQPYLHRQLIASIAFSKAVNRPHKHGRNSSNETRNRIALHVAAWSRRDVYEAVFRMEHPTVVSKIQGNLAGKRRGI